MYVPRHILSLLEQKGGYWLSSGRTGKYQAILLDNSNVRLQVTSALNPATLLPIDGAQSPEHDCLHFIELVYSSRPDLTDQPSAEPDMELFTNGSSCMDQGSRHAGYVVVNLKKIVEAKALPPRELSSEGGNHCTDKSPTPTEGKGVNIYTGSWLCVLHGACSWGNLEGKGAPHFEQ